jgi:hypothetical protein
MDYLFETFDCDSIHQGELFNLDGATVYGLTSNRMFRLHDGSWFIFVQMGAVVVDHHLMRAGHFGVFNGGIAFAKDDTRALLIHVPDFNTIPMCGGPIESEGRLKYIDGCTDTMLLAPLKVGDPCLNFLHFPPHVKQTMHTHPSFRVGIVTRGSGQCVTPWGNVPLVPGLAFIIKARTGAKLNGYEVGSHCFYTDTECMDIVSFHPDSEVGPTDEVHQMRIGTIINEDQKEAV